MSREIISSFLLARRGSGQGIKTCTVSDCTSGLFSVSATSSETVFSSFRSALP